MFASSGQHPQLHCLSTTGNVSFFRPTSTTSLSLYHRQCFLLQANIHNFIVSLPQAMFASSGQHPQLHCLSTTGNVSFFRPTSTTSLSLYHRQCFPLQANIHNVIVSLPQVMFPSSGQHPQLHCLSTTGNVCFFRPTSTTSLSLYHR